MQLLGGGGLPTSTRVTHSGKAHFLFYLGFSIWVWAWVTIKPPSTRVPCRVPIFDSHSQIEQPFLKSLKENNCWHESTAFIWGRNERNHHESKQLYVGVPDFEKRLSRDAICQLSQKTLVRLREWGAGKIENWLEHSMRSAWKGTYPFLFVSQTWKLPHTSWAEPGPAWECTYVWGAILNRRMHASQREMCRCVCARARASWTLPNRWNPTLASFWNPSFPTGVCGSFFRFGRIFFQPLECCQAAPQGHIT